MAGVIKGEIDSRGDRVFLVIGQAPHQTQGADHVILIIDRFGLLKPTRSALNESSDVLGVGRHDVGGVHQHGRAEIVRGGRRVDWATIAFFIKRR